MSSPWRGAFLCMVAPRFFFFSAPAEIITYKYYNVIQPCFFLLRQRTSNAPNGSTAACGVSGRTRPQAARAATTDGEAGAPRGRAGRPDHGGGPRALAPPIHPPEPDTRRAPRPRPQRAAAAVVPGQAVRRGPRGREGADGADWVCRHHVARPAQVGPGLHREPRGDAQGGLRQRGRGHKVKRVWVSRPPPPPLIFPARPGPARRWLRFVAPCLGLLQEHAAQGRGADLHRACCRAGRTGTHRGRSRSTSKGRRSARST